MLYVKMKRHEKRLASASTYGHNNSFWTLTENKLFENALPLYDSKTPDRWHKVVAMIPSKTASDAYKQYQELEADVSCIEAGLVNVPLYNTRSFSLELESGDNSAPEGFKQSNNSPKKTSGKGCHHERKKGIPWTEEEHRLFLLGLEKYGKGDWRNISRNLVVSKTPTQVASHAQKYSLRLSSGSKDKGRSSIHDITTVNVTDDRLPSLTISPSLPRQTPSGSVSGIRNGFLASLYPCQICGVTSGNSGPDGGFSIPYVNFSRDQFHDNAPHTKSVVFHIEP